MSIYEVCHVRFLRLSRLTNLSFSGLRNPCRATHSTLSLTYGIPLLALSEKSTSIITKQFLSNIIKIPSARKGKLEYTHWHWVAGFSVNCPLPRSGPFRRPDCQTQHSCRVINSAPCARFGAKYAKNSIKGSVVSSSSHDSKRWQLGCINVRFGHYERTKRR
jgi:hypothetical protein